MSFWKKWWKGERHTAHWPDYVQTYANSFDHFRKNEPLENYRFVVFDTETSSLDVKEAKLLSIGAVTLENFEVQVASALHCMVNWGENYRPENVEIHGITQASATDGLQPEEVIALFLERIAGAVLVAHHARFDQAIINTILDKYFKGLKLYNPIIDTAQLAIKLEHPSMSTHHINPKEYSLDALMDRYHITPLERHTALGDAYSTALLCSKLLKKLKKRGVAKLSSMLK